MPRRKRLRRVVAPPGFKGYNPYGANNSPSEHVELLYEEYEALKLADYDFLNHDEASKLMGISRPTFARIYESARRKIAKALVEVRSIKTVFGNVELDKSWYVCDNCHTRFTIPKTFTKKECPLCASDKIDLLNK